MNTENYDLNSLLHPNVELKGEKISNEYKPTADKGINGVYKSIVRFIPWYKNPTKSYIEKWSSWLVDPVTQRGRSIDCPSSVGKDSPLLNTYRKLKRSDSVVEQNKAEIFSRKQVFAFLIQVIKDDQNKDLEGKILVWKVGKKVWEKYEAERKPILGEPNEPFDLIDGKPFAIVIPKVSGWNNYDQCKFIDQKIPLLIPKEGKLYPINQSTSPSEIFEFLKENSPNLDEYGYKEWDNETYDYVNQIITQVTGQVATPANIANVRNSTTSASPISSPENVSSMNLNTNFNMPTIEEINVEDLSSSMGNMDIPDLDMSSSGGLNLQNLDEALKNI